MCYLCHIKIFGGGGGLLCDVNSWCDRVEVYEQSHIYGIHNMHNIYMSNAPSVCVAVHARVCFLCLEFKIMCNFCILYTFISWHNILAIN